ncbi:MAG: DUF3656 domain-containing protein [Planctomycetota bacterium]
MEEIVRRVAATGVDAVILQDPALALLAGRLCPDLELHGSTQMTITTGEAAEFAAGIGISRVVVPRELSVSEIRAFARATSMELEVFVHGALCVSWSGQCLTSEAWSGRSANRGQCAQSCRLPYRLLVDGVPRDLGEIRYLLSPRDLAGLGAVKDLMGIGVHGFKIEGRQKNAQYVSTAVNSYRRQVDQLCSGRAPDAAEVRSDLAEMALSFSRGFGEGFLLGPDHQALVDGRFPKHRGIFLGMVEEVQGQNVVIQREAPECEIRPGMGVVFDAGNPEDPDEPGGPVFHVSMEGERIRLRFGRPGPALREVRPGQRVWVTSDPEITRRVEKQLRQAPKGGRIPLSLTVRGEPGGALEVVATGRRPFAISAQAKSEHLLEQARGGGLDEPLLRDKLCAFGETPYRVESLDVAGLAGGLHLPVSALKQVRRRLVKELDEALSAGCRIDVSGEKVLPGLRSDLAQRVSKRIGATPPPEAACLVPLCRNLCQVEAALDAGLAEVELDWMELVGLAEAVKHARGGGLKVTLATLRVQKPGEESYLFALRRLAPDAYLVRHWSSLVSLAGTGGAALHGDFSLNVTNSLTALHLLGWGLDTVTASYDLNEAQTFALLGAVPAHAVTVMLHHRIPTFHTEHCVYSHLLSDGADHRTCGRPCERYQIALEDPSGGAHPVIVDAGCRNTVFNSQAQTAAAAVERLLHAGVRRFRIEFVRESREEAGAVLEAYGRLLRGLITPSRLMRELGVESRVGI